MNLVNLKIHKGKVIFDRAGYGYTDVLNTLGNAIYYCMRVALRQEPEKKDLIYEMANVAFSNILEAFDPTRENFPDFTIDAIRYAEDILIQEKLSEVPAERREQIQAQLKERRDEYANRISKYGEEINEPSPFEVQEETHGEEPAV